MTNSVNVLNDAQEQTLATFCQENSLDYQSNRIQFFAIVNVDGSQLGMAGYAGRHWLLIAPNGKITEHTED